MWKRQPRRRQWSRKIGDPWQTPRQWDKSRRINPGSVVTIAPTFQSGRIAEGEELSVERGKAAPPQTVLIDPRHTLISHRSNRRLHFPIRRHPVLQRGCSVSFWGTSACSRRHLFVAAALFCLARIGIAADERPNIVFLFTDDHAPHAIGAYSDFFKSINPTPNLDKLASEGMVFVNSFCTNSICGPSRAVIQTGKHSHVNGFMSNGNRFNGDQQTFPKLLQKAGYQTAIVGKWHLGTDPQGFDFWQVLPGQGDYYNPDFLTPNGRIREDGYCTDIVTDKAINWLKENATGEKPFMLMCQHKAPHRTWMPAIRHLNLYDDVEIPEPSTLFDTWEDNASPA
ncbi:MAG: sulfatase-like hydrolase/transferase, partial [Planctomycetaceae bacterium]|nr:sulfatase-like hydrolase/transferase [Planctomycetaceae bacterium]